MRPGRRERAWFVVGRDIETGTMFPIHVALSEDRAYLLATEEVDRVTLGFSHGAAPEEMDAIRAFVSTIEVLPGWMLVEEV